MNHGSRIDDTMVTYNFFSESLPASDSDRFLESCIGFALDLSS
jgi:hypothetical protein